MRSSFQRFRPRHCACLLGALAVASGCVAGSSNDGAGFIPVKEAGLGGAVSFVFDSGSVDAQAVGDAGLVLDPRCGASNYCKGGPPTPDNENACIGFGAKNGGPARHPDAGVRHLADASLGSEDASSALDAGADAGDASRSTSAPSGEHEAGVHLRSFPIPQPLPPPPPAPPDAGTRYSCQVGRDNSGSPVHQCAPSGTRGERELCDSSSDCAPGYACVGTTDPGQCLHYCCAPSTPCGAGAYCTGRPLLDDANDKKPLIVPVCALGNDCSLLEPFPCSGPTCTCTDPTTTCTVVRSDGTRGCVTPGTGKVNDKCGHGAEPCAAGYYCSLATSLCVKMCMTNGIDDRCSPGKCQAANGFPAGFGLCVGYTPSVQ